MEIVFDSRAKAYSDGKNYVHPSIIRRYAKEKMGFTAVRGRIANKTIEAYWLDTFEVIAHVK